jgi:hypothetical protein
VVARVAAGGAVGAHLDQFGEAGDEVGAADGNHGAGKTTLARERAARVGVPFTELGTLAYGPEWCDRHEYATDVISIARGPRWVVDSHGTPDVRRRLWSLAGTLV